MSDDGAGMTCVLTGWKIITVTLQLMSVLCNKKNKHSKINYGKCVIFNIYALIIKIWMDLNINNVCLKKDHVTIM